VARDRQAYLAVRDEGTPANSVPEKKTFSGGGLMFVYLYRAIFVHSFDGGNGSTSCHHSPTRRRALLSRSYDTGCVLYSPSTARSAS